jgi:hypothetical protein
MWLALPGFGACDRLYKLLLTEAVGAGVVGGGGEGGVEVGDDTILVRAVRGLSQGARSASKAKKQAPAAEKKKPETSKKND